MARNPFTGQMRPTRRVIGPATARRGHAPLDLHFGVADGRVILVFEYAGSRVTSALTPDQALQMAATLADAAYRADPAPVDDLLADSIARTP